MSMNEFEREENTSGEESSPLTIHSSHYPNDFNEDDLAFAQELNTLFSPEAEELPPYYVQTLLDADDQRYDPVERGFEYKTSARVFRRLKLRRRLFYTHASPLSALSMDISNAPARRSLLALAATFLAVFLLTVAFTAPSFASGVALLLRGNHTGGVVPVSHYPSGRIPSAQDDVQIPQTTLSLMAAQQQMHFQMYWPQNKPDEYALANINLYVGLDQHWADGPMLEFEYRLTSPGNTQGTGKIWIREFKPKATVLQLVKEGASVPIQMDNSGHALAIYVDGQWVRHGKNPPVWVSGERSELIYQINGVLFWIVGDQRDNIGKQQLMQIAQGLEQPPMPRQFAMMGSATLVNQVSNTDVPGPFSNDVILIDTPDGIDGPYYVNENSTIYRAPHHFQ